MLCVLLLSCSLLVGGVAWSQERIVALVGLRYAPLKALQLAEFADICVAARCRAVGLVQMPNLQPFASKAKWQMQLVCFK